MINLNMKYVCPREYYRLILNFYKRSKVKDIQNLLRGKIGMEIGGPSRAFSNLGILPIYRLAKRIDGINFSSDTIWDKNETDKYYDKSGKILGNKYIMDGTKLEIGTKLKEKSYDFILSSNNLEHIANPLKALEQWLSILKKEGIIILILPVKKYNFDHNRNTVEFSHLLDDYNRNISENDMSHYDEIISLHDLKKDSYEGTYKEFIERSKKNHENRCFHQHIFDFKVLEEIGFNFNLKIIEEVNLVFESMIVLKK